LGRLFSAAKDANIGAGGTPAEVIALIYEDTVGSADSKDTALFLILRFGSLIITKKTKIPIKNEEITPNTNRKRVENKSEVVRKITAIDKRTIIKEIIVAIRELNKPIPT
jgi:hypothetical protein